MNSPYISSMTKALLTLYSFYTGVLSIWVQLIFVRALISLTGGAEIIIGIFFFIWLFMVSLGAFSFTGVRWSRIDLLIILLSMVVILDYIVVFHLFRLFALQPYAGVSPGIVLVLTTCVLVVPCFIIGALFSSISAAFKKIGFQGGVRTYYLEAIGTGVASLFFSLCLVWVLQALELLLVNLYFVLSFFIYRAFLSRVRRLWRIFLLGLALIPLLISLYFFTPYDFQSRLMGCLFPGLEVQGTVETEYGSAILLQYYESSLLVSGGSTLFSYPLDQGQEEKLILPFLIKQDMRRVLFLGLYPFDLRGFLPVDIDSFTLVYHDGRLLSFLKEKGFSVPGFIVDDERRFLRRIKAKYDLIHFDFPSPEKLENNRFYTREFFQLIRERLSAGGILHFTLPGGENRLNPLQALLARITEQTLRSVFPEVKVIYGDPLHFLASEEQFQIVPDSLVSALQRRDIQTTFLTPSILRDKLSPFRQSFFQANLPEISPGQINRDFYPFSHRLTTNLYLKKMVSGMGFREYKKPFFVLEIILLAIILVVVWLKGDYRGSGVFTIRRPLFFLLLILVVGNLLFFRTELWEVAILFISVLTFFTLFLMTILDDRSMSPGKGLVLRFVAFLVGFVTMGLELIVISVFQVKVGRLFWAITLIFSVYMLGLGAGTWLLLKIQEFQSRTKLLFLFLTLSLLMVFPMIAIFLEAYRGEHLFYLIVLVTGISGGIFMGMLFQKSEQLGLPSGVIYAYDSFGAALSAVIVNLLLIPFTGYVLPAFILLLSFFLIMDLILRGYGRL